MYYDYVVQLYLVIEKSKFPKVSFALLQVPNLFKIPQTIVQKSLKRILVLHLNLLSTLSFNLFTRGLILRENLNLNTVEYFMKPIFYYKTKTVLNHCRKYLIFWFLHNYYYKCVPLTSTKLNPVRDCNLKNLDKQQNFVHSHMFEFLTKNKIDAKRRW